MTKQATSSAVEEHYRKAATQLWSDNELEIDSDATVSERSRRLGSRMGLGEQ